MQQGRQLIYANSNKQQLDQHSLAVGLLAKIIFEQFIDSNEYAELAKATYIAGCLHDIGKLDVLFQNWLIEKINKGKGAVSEELEDGTHIDGKFSFDEHPRHNEVSVLLYSLLDDPSIKCINSSLKQTIKHVIYWHHALAFRKENQDEFTTYAGIAKKLTANHKDNQLKNLVAKTKLLIAKIAKLEANYLATDNPLIAKVCTATNTTIINLAEKELPVYKDYSVNERSLEEFTRDIKHNATANIIRSCVITADRWISSLTAVELNDHIANKTLTDFAQQQFDKTGLNNNSKLIADINQFLADFNNDDRSSQQTAIAEQLAADQDNIQVLAGAAGCGKTKIALEWAKNTNAKKLIWICPRVQICQSLFEQLTSTEYLAHTSVEIYTGEYKDTNKPRPKDDNSASDQDDNYFSSNIVITTIDQILNYIISHTKTDRLLNYLAAHVVFDEYHEYISMPAFNLLFAELLASKEKSATKINTLLVSATPNYTYLDNILGIDPDDVIKMPSFNKCNYQLEFVEYDEDKLDDTNPLYQPQEKSTFVISNTAITAQLSYLKNQQQENAILFHSKFTTLDKKEIFDTVFNCFKQHGNGKFEVLRSGPITQASLNITSNDNMISEITTPENQLQRTGRLDRFGENTNGINKLIIAIPQDFTKKQGAVASFLAKNNCLATTRKWYQFLLAKTTNKQLSFTLEQMYNWYEEFHDSHRKTIIQDLISALQQSVKVITNKLNSPLVISNKTTNSKLKIAFRSIRSDNRFVQMAVCDLTNNKINYTNTYAVDITTAEANSITESIDRLQALGLIEHAAKKDARINPNSLIEDVPKKHREKILISAAREQEQPIYLSYTRDDLNKIGESKNHSNAMFYTKTDRQAVGLLNLKQFKGMQQCKK